MSSQRQLWLTATAMLLCLLVFSVTPLDIWVQRALYLPPSHQWLWSSDEPVLRLLLYDGIKLLLALFVIALIVLLTAGRNRPVVRSHREGLWVVVLSMILVPLSVSMLKAATLIPCPKNLVVFGGDLPHASLLSQLFGNELSSANKKCFPAGHASGGFALMSLYFLFDSRKARRQAVWFALANGWLMGVYKMAIGDHFLSHTLMSMLIAWFEINVIYLAVHRLFNRAPDGAGS